VTEYFLEHPNFSSASSADITDIRSSNVSGSFFAFLTVKFGLHKYLKFSSPSLSQDLENFVHFLQSLIKTSHAAANEVHSLDNFPKVNPKSYLPSKLTQLLYSLKHFLF
jgi:dsRNA-specific ribonuclease